MSKIIDASVKDVIAKLYNENLSIEVIADQLGISSFTVRAYVKQMLENGKLQERGRINPCRHKAKDVDGVKETAKKIRAVKKVEEDVPLSGDGWVRCTHKIATTCVYGCSPYGWKMGYCNYILVNKKMRGCPWERCTHYEKITKDKPRLYKEVSDEEFNPMRKGKK